MINVVIIVVVIGDTVLWPLYIVRLVYVRTLYTHGVCAYTVYTWCVCVRCILMVYVRTLYAWCVCVHCIYPVNTIGSCDLNPCNKRSVNTPCDTLGVIVYTVNKYVTYIVLITPGTCIVISWNV